MQADNGAAPLLYFVGSVGGMERAMVAESGVPFADYAEVRAGPLHGVGVGTMIASLGQTLVGTRQAIGHLRRWRSDAVDSCALLMTGGWVNFPVALAAALLRIPALIYLPDIEPGLAIKVLRHLARRVAVTTEASYPYFRRGQAVATGYPLRESITQATRAAGSAHFRLHPDKRTLLAFGGSRGARSINTAVIDIVPALLADGWQIIHVTGTLDHADITTRRAGIGAPADYQVFAYLHDDMGLAMAAADVALCRSGASTLGELPHFALPAILVPYPHAWRYQKVNADYLAERGAALVLRDEDMARDLLPTLRRLAADNSAIETMRERARALQSNGSRAIAREWLALTEQARQ